MNKAASRKFDSSSGVLGLLGSVHSQVKFPKSLGARVFFGYGISGRETADRTASSILSTASFLLKPLSRLSERQV